MKIRVLIVDDAPFIHEVLKSFLSRFHLEIIGHAYDGEEMVNLVMEKKPDLVFADMAMPKLNGIDATRKALDQLPSVQVIAMSSMASEHLIAEAVAAGCVDFVDKSFPLNHLTEAIDSVRARLMQVREKEVVNG